MFEGWKHNTPTGGHATGRGKPSGTLYGQGNLCRRKREQAGNRPLQTERQMHLDKITRILIISLIAAFSVRTIGTAFPIIFQNEYTAKISICVHLFFMIVQSLFFLLFFKIYAAHRKKVLRIGSALAIIGSLSVMFIYLKSFFQVFNLDFIPPSLMYVYLDVAIPLISSLFHILFFCIFKQVQSQSEYPILNRPLSSAIAGVGIFIALHLIVLIHFLNFHTFKWTAHMHRVIVVATLPLIALAAILLLYFYFSFYRFVSNSQGTLPADSPESRESQT